MLSIKELRVRVGPTGSVSHIAVNRVGCRLALEIGNPLERVGSEGRGRACEGSLSTALDLGDPTVKSGNQFV